MPMETEEEMAARLAAEASSQDKPAAETGDAKEEAAAGDPAEDVVKDEEEPAAAAQETAQPAAAGLTADEVKALIQEALGDVAKDVHAFLESELAPLRSDVQAMGKDLEAAMEALKVLTPESAGNLVADITAMIEDGKKVMADAAPILTRIGSLESKLKHWL